MVCINSFDGILLSMLIQGKYFVLTKKQFIIKFILWFNLYANVLFFICIFCFIVAVNLCNIISVILIISSIVLFFFGVRITLRFEKKYQYYKIQEERIKKHGYSMEYFENGVMDPCFRLLTRQILYEFDRIKDYKTIIKNFGNSERILIYKSNKLLEKIKEEENRNN